MSRFRKYFTPSQSSNGNGNGKTVEQKTVAEPVAVQEMPEPAVVEAASLPETSDSGDESPSALKKFISALMNELQERDTRIKALQADIDGIRAAEHAIMAERDEEWARGVASRDGLITELEEDLLRERNEKAEALERLAELEHEEQQFGVGSRVGVDVSSILHAAETAADNLRTQTEAETAELRSKAKSSAREIVSKAKGNADQIRSAAESEAAAFQAKMQQVVGEVRQAYRSLGELASSLSHLDEPAPVRVTVESTEEIDESTEQPVEVTL